MKSLAHTPIFALQNAYVAYEQTIALKNLTLEIEAGEKIALIGPSGAGKTTLLQTLYEQAPDQASMVHQHYALVAPLSVFHNVYIGRLDRYSTLQNILNLIKPQKKVADGIAPILNFLGIQDKMFDKVGTLSGGQQQRVAVARAIYRGQNILLADEPVSSVDPHQAGSVIASIMKSADTVVMSLHAVEVALKFAERIIGLREGEMKFDLPVDQVTPAMLQELYQNQAT